MPSKSDLGQRHSLTRQLFKPTLLITGVNLVSLLVAFITQLILASLFGAQSQMDAYLAAVLLPAVVSAVLLGSAGFVIIPFFIQYRSEEGHARAWQMASSFLNLAALVLAALTLLGMALRHALLRMVVPGLEPATLNLAAELALVLWPTLLLGGLSTVMILLSQAEEKFVWQALVPLAGSSLQLAIIILWGSYGIMTQAWAGLAGNLIQFALLLSMVWGAGRYTFRAPFWSPEIKKLTYLIIPVVGSRLFSDTSGVIDRYLASLLAVGSIARLAYAGRIPMLAIGLFSSAIGVTIFPSLSRSVAEDNIPELRRTFSVGTRYTWLFYIPLVVITSVLAGPLVATLLQRGRFLQTDTATVAALLPWYMVSMLARVLGNVSSRTLYAMKYVRMMSMLNVLSIVVYIGLVFPLVRRLGIVGMPMATAIGDWFFYFMHCLLVWDGTGRLVEREMLSGIARITLAALLSGGVTWLVSTWSGLPAPPRLVVGSVVGVLAFGAFLTLLRAPEIKSLTGILRNRVAQFGFPLAR